MAGPHSGSPTAFEALVDDYDAARPTYPEALYDEIAGLTGGTVLEREPFVVRLWVVVPC